MEKQLEAILLKMNEQNKKMDELKNEFQKQINVLTETFNKTVSTTIEEKIQPLISENISLKNEVKTLKEKTYFLEKEVRKNNVLLHGIAETENNQTELQEMVLEILNQAGKTVGLDNFDKWEASDIYRLGQRKEGKIRPILIKLTLSWRKTAILRNNKNFPNNIYATEDFPKEIIEVRKQLTLKKQEEIAKGNHAVIRYDKLIVKGHNNEKRKRSPSTTPTRPGYAGTEESRTGAPNKINKINAFKYMNRSKPNTSNKQ